ncbi:uncharacterized protein [Lepeophtheirus salmonis]|uniref:uncharacterized protein n=1 Tax=Lepeophtheirus salmonis TaxID=72036 RepID=UPI001AEB3F52|nr:uncharacterized protein LOC121116218 [Lepeophtheirus salmonis]
MGKQETKCETVQKTDQTSSIQLDVKNLQFIKYRLRSIPNNLLYVTCNEKRFLIDTVSQRSIVPKTSHSSYIDRVPPKLVAAYGAPVETSSLIKLLIKFKPVGRVEWEFVMANIEYGVIGAGFLGNFRLSVNMECRMLRRNEVLTTIEERCKFTNKLCTKFATPQSEKEFHSEPRHVVKHEIFTTGSPCYSRTRRITSEKEAIVKADISKLISAGTLQMSKSNWSSSIHLVEKPDGSLCMVRDNRQLNNVTLS